MNKTDWIISFAPAILLYILFTPCSKAEFVTQPQDKLRGVADSGMAVVIEDLGAKEKEHGLIDSKIKADIENKLKGVGIKIVSLEGQPPKAERYPYLYLNINAAFIENTPSVVYNVTLDVEREAVLIPEAVLEITEGLVRKGFHALCDKQDAESIKAAEKICEQEKMSADQSSLKPLQNKVSCYATVWHKEYLGLIPNKKMAGKIGELINSLVDEFLSDYKVANTKGPAVLEEAI